ncbi:MAG: alpha/beta hydrolase [Steroidobacter sp.]
MTSVLRRVVILLPVYLVLAVSNVQATSLRDGHYWATINGHKMYYEVHGHGSSLLLLHGGGSSGAESFEQQLHVFARHHQIILPDQVGQGRTPDVSGALSYTAMMRDTLALLNLLQLKKVDVVGFSDGGILALMLAVNHPQRIGRVVVSGVNIAPEGLTADTLQDLRAIPLPDEPRTLDEKLRQLWLHAPTSKELNLELLSKINHPVLVISGDRDAITLEHTLQIYRAIPHAELCILPGTDHGTFTGRPDWVNPITLSFLDRRN